MRGDWYLAVEGGSRSDRLADAALDILNSQRANIARFQYGLGKAHHSRVWRRGALIGSGMAPQRAASVQVTRVASQVNR